MKNARDVYAVTEDSKDQKTCLFAANVAGEMLPLFAGECFQLSSELLMLILVIQLMVGYLQRSCMAGWLITLLENYH